jgi:hypothetical protein
MDVDLMVFPFAFSFTGMRYASQSRGKPRLAAFRHVSPERFACASLFPLSAESRKQLPAQPMRRQSEIARMQFFFGNSGSPERKLR